jgi:hypothetical protein
MLVNLVDETKSLFSNQLVIKGAAYLNESETGVAKAITGIVPIVFQQLVNKTFTHEGAGIVAQMAGEEQHSGVVDNIEDIFNNENFLQKGNRLFNTLFDNKPGTVTGLLSNFSGLTTSSAAALLSIAIPAVLAVTGKHFTGGAMGMAVLLNDQKDNIAAAMPGGLHSDVPGEWNAATHIGTAPVIIVNDIPETVETDSMLRILLPMLILVMLALAVFYVVGKLV